jgi:choline kinase
MRAIILAAGFGSRLMPLTADRPKGMVLLAGLPLLARQVSVLRGAGVKDISLVGGYLAGKLETLGLPVFLNPKYDATNMVESLMSARELFDGTDDLLMAYGDIVYEPRVLESVLETAGEIVVAADRQWQKLWSSRMADYTQDVESFRLTGSGRIAELGRRPGHLDEVQAQYIGLVRFPASCHARLLSFYDGLDRNGVYDGQPFHKMYMTSLVQLLVDASWDVRPALIDGGWLEVDTLDDLQRYEKMRVDGKLDALCNLAPAPDPKEIIRELTASFVAEPNDVCDISVLASGVGSFPTIDEHVLGLLDKLARKIEIVGTLYRRYSLSDGKLVGRASIATPSEAGALLAAYLLAYDQTGDSRHLNTLLKALDGTLRMPRPALYHELDRCCSLRLGEHG